MTSKWITSLISGVALIGVTLTSALPASAEQAPDNNGPGVARVSVVQGSAVVQRGDSNKQVAAIATRRYFRAITSRPARPRVPSCSSTAHRRSARRQRAGAYHQQRSEQSAAAARRRYDRGRHRSRCRPHASRHAIGDGARERAGDYRIAIGTRRLELGNHPARQRGSRHAAAHVHARSWVVRWSRADRPRIRRSRIRRRSDSTRSTISTRSAIKRWSPRSTQART